MTLRDATPADAAELAAVQLAAWRRAYPGIVPDDFLAAMDIGELTARWERFLGQDSARTLVAVGDARIRGYCSIGGSRDADHDPRRIGEIRAIYVHPERWRCGVGRELCAAALAQFQAAGYAAVTLWVAEGNHRAQRFYATLGFVDDGGRKFESAGVPIRHLRYRWTPPGALVSDAGAR